MGKEGKPTQGFVIKPVTFMDNWGSVLLEPSKEPCRTRLKNCPPKGQFIPWLAERMGTFIHQFLPPVGQGLSLGVLILWHVHVAHA